MAKKTYQPLLTDVVQPFDISKVKVDIPRVYAKPRQQNIKPVLPITSPSLGRLGIRPTTSQIEQQKSQALQDIKSSAFTRANVGAMQGLSPIGFKLGKEEQAILDKSKAYKAGEIVGTMAGFALPYAGLGKGVLQGTAKLAPRLVPNASGAISKGITKLAPKVATETAEKVGKGITESLIKDIAIGTPMNVAYAYGKEDLRGTDALKNIAFNTGLDLITGGILEAVPLVLKSGKKVASKAEFEALPKEEQDEVIQLLLPAPKEVEAKMIPENRVIAGGQILERQFKPISKEEYLTKTASRINKLDDAQRKLKTKVLTQEEFSDIGKLALDEYDKTVKSVADYMSNYKPKGTETTILPKYGDELMRDGTIRTTISNNDIWYQDFYKKFGRKPNKSEIPELAENLVKQSLKSKSGEFYNEALGNMLDEIKNVKVGTADNTIKRQLDKLTDELTSTIGMTDEEFSKYAQSRQLGKLVTAEPTPPLQFKTQISADELLKAQNKALEPQKLEKGKITPDSPTIYGSSTRLPIADLPEPKIIGEPDIPQTQSTLLKRQNFLSNVTDKGLKSLEEAVANPYLDIHTANAPNVSLKNNEVLLYRREETGKKLSDKPQGLYTTPVYFGKAYTPFKDVGDSDVFLKAKINNPLITKNVKDTTKRGNVELSSGVSALRELSPSEYDFLKMLNKSDTEIYVKNNYPDIPLERTTDGYEIMERLGAYKAKEKGYDALYSTNPDDPLFDEIVLLNEKYKKIAEIKTPETINFKPQGIQPQLKPLGADINRIQPTTQANLERYGTMRQGEQLTDELGEAVTREIEVPKGTAYGDTMQFARTVAESKNVTDEFADDILNAINEGDFAKATKSNAVAVDNANRIIDTEGLQSARGRFKNSIESGKALTSEDMAIGARLVQEYQKVGDNKATMDILSDMANGLSEVGRTLQSARILKRLSPEGRLMTVQKMANKIGDKTGTKIELSDDIIEKVKKATTEKEITEVNHEVSQHIWEQVPPTLQDKLNAWRYMAMLTNTRTHFRNFIGNAIFIPARELKNVIGAGLEKAFIKGEKTKAIMPDSELVDFAKADWQNAKPLFDKTSKYDEGLRDLKAKVFKTKALENVRRFNVWALEKEDEWFKYLAYKSSLSQYMKANNLKPSDMVGETLDRSRRYAINEAKKATFTDDSAIANFLTKAKKSARESDSTLKKAGGIALESALPFTKTPINILKRGFEYSPIGLGKTITKGVNDLKKGKITANEFIDDISKGLSGTALTGLGAILGYNEMVNSTQDGTRKEQDYSRMLGEQNYSIDTGDGTYTIDWAAPLSLPFFIGVELAKAAKQDGLTLGETLDGLQSIANPILELSMLQGLTNSIEEFGVSSKTQGEKLIGAIHNTIVGYLSQFMPTLGGQLARIITPERKVTTSTEESQTIKMWQTALKKMQSKIPVPVVQSRLEPYVDVWGRTETVDNAIDRFVANMISPGYYKEKKSDEVDREISRLAKSIGADAIPRGVTNYTVQANNQKYRMTDQELTQFKKDKGRAAYDGVQKLIMTSEYRMATDDKKAKMLDKVYRNSQDIAKENFFSNRGMSY